MIIFFLFLTFHSFKELWDEFLLKVDNEASQKLLEGEGVMSVGSSIQGRNLSFVNVDTNNEHSLVQGVIANETSLFVLLRHFA